MYLNITSEHFSVLMSQLSLVDEKKVVKKIFTGVILLLHRFFDLNYLFFYESFDLFGQINGSGCFGICSNKPKYGAYCRPKCRLEFTMLFIISKENR